MFMQYAGRAVTIRLPTKSPAEAEAEEQKIKIWTLINFFWLGRFVPY
jgi:hypothetical protein